MSKQKTNGIAMPSCCSKCGNPAPQADHTDLLLLLERPVKSWFSARTLTFCAATVLMVYCDALALVATKSTIVNTAHNLSTSGGMGPGHVRSVSEERVCIFCHTPHHANSEGPLWSRDVPDASPYTFYWSKTLQSAAPLRPGGPSRLCLSCHDGTIALGKLSKGAYLDSTLSALSPSSKTNLGTSLSRNHPITVEYGLKTDEFHPGTTLAMKNIKLSAASLVECTSCHNPHNDQYGKFLVTDTSNQHDALCTNCHKPSGWGNNINENVHRTGGNRFAYEKDKVAQDGCVSCHTPHNAARGPQLLKLTGQNAGLDTNCISTCHKDATYRDLNFKDVFTQFSESIYKHQVSYNPLDSHDTLEILPLSEPHVECVDCHNPHQASWEGVPLGSASPAQPPSSKAPYVNGPLRGVRGITIAGQTVNPSSYEYEICFKCHSGTSARIGKFNSPLGRPARRIEIFDERYRFLSKNPSSHPVAATRSGDGRSLLDKNMTQIYCSDCHAHHGSNQPAQLKVEYSDTPSIDGNYALCFRCHDREFLLNPLAPYHAESATLHKNHIYGLHRNGSTKASCSACHDPHGVSADQGGTAENNSHLINFDTRYAGIGAIFSAPARSCTVNGACHIVNIPYSYEY